MRLFLDSRALALSRDSEAPKSGLALLSFENAVLLAPFRSAPKCSGRVYSTLGQIIPDRLFLSYSEVINLFKKILTLPTFFNCSKQFILV